MSQEKTIGDLISSHHLVLMSPEETVSAASRAMFKHRIGVAVVAEQRRAVGVLTERDINYRVVAAGLDPTTTKLSEVMTRNLIMIDPATKVSDALRQVVNNYFRYALVGRDGIVEGIVVVGAIFSEVTKLLGQDIGDMERFIRGDA